MLKDCVFCTYDNKSVLFENSSAIAISDGYPVSEGHTLIVTKRHISNFFSCTPSEIAEIYELLIEARDFINTSFEPCGYNVGINIGSCAGQTVNHVHIHLIPRYPGDISDPRGGVRNIIPNLVSYPFL